MKNKNIWLLPTDKPSRLYLTTHEYIFEEGYSLSTDECENKHIYITSDEEIKEGDWCYYLNILGGGNIVCQAYKHSGDKRILFDDGTYNRKIGEGITPLIGECKKIILTTDQSLDGVQAIDDEFLEWFVKNPSCEEIEVDNEPFDITEKGEWLIEYKPIIPKKEPNQIKCYCGHTTYCDCGPLEEPKQETLQDKLKSLVNGWQQQQIQYETLAEHYVNDQHNNRKFTYKAMATRDCWKELLKLIEDEK